MSESTVTNPVGTEVSEGSERRRTSSEIQDSLTQMLRADYAEPQEEEQHSDPELGNIEEDVVESELYDDSDEVDGMDEEADGEQSDSDTASYRVIIDGKKCKSRLTNSYRDINGDRHSHRRAKHWPTNAERLKIML